MNEVDRYDVAVLGAGPGGYVCAYECAKRGLKTALIEARELGGTCLNRGCVPTKTLLQSANFYRETLEAAKLGVSVENVAFDYEVANARREKIVAQLRQGVKSLEKNAGVELIVGRGVLTSGNSIRVESEGQTREITAEKIVLAVGAKPVKLPIPGLDSPEIWTSDELLAAANPPESVVIIGGGVIGVEFASLFGALGKKVVVLEAAHEILPNVDSDLTKLLARRFKKLKIDVRTGVQILNVETSTNPNVARVYFGEKGETREVEAERCVVCVGRRPATSGIGLDAAGVKVDARGFIVVDEFMCASAPNVLAIGDATGKIQLAHVASEQARVAARVCAGEFVDPMNYDAVPSCVYTEPEIASVGLTEQAAREKNENVVVGTFRVPSNARAMASGLEIGLVKIVAEGGTRRLLGAHILSPRATDMIAELALALRQGATVDEIVATIHPHPTFAECVADAARSIDF